MQGKSGKKVAKRVEVCEIDLQLQEEAVVAYTEVANLLHNDERFQEYTCCIDTFPEIDPTQIILVIGIFDPIVGADDPPMCWYTYQQVAVVVRINIHTMRVWVGDAYCSHLYSLELPLVSTDTILAMVKKVLHREHAGA